MFYTLYELLHHSAIRTGGIRIITHNKQNRLFFASLLVTLAVHLIFAFLPHFLPDESFYTTIPYRLFCGDSLIRDEWHLSQFSSFFSFLPMSLWLTITSSADGLIIFLRLTYLALHTTATVVIYRLFREYKTWAIAASLIYYLQTPYKIYAISYHSMFALFLLFFSICLFLIYQNSSKKRCCLAGASFAACCIGNPVFVITLLLYPVLWLVTKIRSRTNAEDTQNTQDTHLVSAFPCTQRDYGNFFQRQAAAAFFLGILSVSAAWLLFFFCTGGTVSSIPTYLRAILKNSEYGTLTIPFSSKVEIFLDVVNHLTLNRPYLLVLLFVAMGIDPKYQRNSHRLVYLSAVFPLSVLCILGMALSPSLDKTLLQSLPCNLLSLVCYILTKNKNKPLFRCMWCPCVIAALINLCISNTLLSSMGFLLAASNVPGIIFFHDLVREMCQTKSKETKTAPSTEKNSFIQQFSHFAVFSVLILQVLLYLFIIQFGQQFPHAPVIATDGPKAGLVMSKESKEDYDASLRDLDLIQKRSNPEDPVLIVSYQSWMYLHLQRPIATYTAWYDAYLNPDAFTDYYRLNPKKIPKYIYVVYTDHIAPLGIHVDNVASTQSTIDILFDYTAEELNNGLLLTVTDYLRN